MQGSCIENKEILVEKNHEIKSTTPACGHPFYIEGELDLPPAYLPSPFASSKNSLSALKISAMRSASSGTSSEVVSTSV